MYRLPKEVYDVLFNNSFDSFTGDRIIGFLCGETKEIYEDMEYVLQHFLPGERLDEPEEEYYLYKMEEFNAKDENEVVFVPEGEEFAEDDGPEPRHYETIIVKSLSELLDIEPGLGKYIKTKNYLN